MPVGLLGKKLGMTRLFDEDGRMRQVTVVEAGPCPVLRHRTEAGDGYVAIQVGFEAVEPERLTKPMRGVFQVLGTDAYRHVAEFRLDGDEDELPDVGSTLTVGEFEPGARVDVRGRTRGRGFQGVVKRHGFAGGPASHGANFHRTPGSIGMAAFPGHVLKGQKMAGQHGSRNRTIRNLSVVQVVPEENLIMLGGGLPGARGSLVRIVRAA